MEQINIAEILKDCPSGMELDCTMFEDVYFDCVEQENGIIKCYIQNNDHKISTSFTKYGYYTGHEKSKCVIFPKGKTTWEGFVPPCKFKDGDVISMENVFGWHTFIYNHITNKYDEYGYYAIITSMGNFKVNSFCNGSKYRFATEEEKQKLFQAIKDNGYKWNAETKTLKKLIIPKFKVGDRVRNKNYKDYIYNILDITDKGYRAKEIDADFPIIILFGSQEDNYELVPNKFDISTLKPFESRVLVRDYDNRIWIPTFWGKHLEDNSNCSYLTTNGCYKYCIPYEANQELIGTTNDCNDFYKTWE